MSRPTAPIRDVENRLASYPCDLVLLRSLRGVLLLVRHGETAANVAGRLLGRSDPPLTALGREQALAAAAALPRPDLVVSSPLQRALETAGAFGREVHVDERWIELDYGDFEGQEAASVPDELCARWGRDTSLAFPGGESLDTLGTRVRPACEALSERAASSVVVVVSHVSPIKAAIAWALDVPDAIAGRMYVEDAGVAHRRRAVRADRALVQPRRVDSSLRAPKKASAVSSHVGS